MERGSGGAGRFSRGGAPLEYVVVPRDELQSLLTSTYSDVEGLAENCSRWQEPLVQAFKALPPGGPFFYHPRVAVVDYVHPTGKKQQAPYVRQLIITALSSLCAADSRSAAASPLARENPAAAAAA
ncbi:hypothetical protein N2152v2_006092 [Parachlorella kessleri]